MHVLRNFRVFFKALVQIGLRNSSKFVINGYGVGYSCSCQSGDPALS